MGEAIRIIGIDPGLRRTGWGIVESLGNSLRFIASGTVRSDDKAALATRLCQLHDGLAEVLHTAMPRAWPSFSVATASLLTKVCSTAASCGMA